MPTVGTEDGTWGTLLNTLIGEFERAITAIHTETFNASDVTIGFTGAADEPARKAILIGDGTLAADVNFVVPNEPKIYLVFNNTTGGSWTLGIKTSTGSRLDIPRTETMLVWCDGANVIKTISAISTGTIALASNALNLGGIAAANYARKGVLNQWTRPQIVDTLQASLTAYVCTPDANVDTTIIIPQSEMGANITVANPTNSPIDGQVLVIVIEQSASTARGVTWGADFIFPDDTNVDLTQTVNKVDAFSFMYSSNLARWINFGTALNLPRS